ncbi:MAG: hypothetical protein QOI11_3917 [Candidatus Eremiobacteraeota bacterium]|jgi:hypothetical protein|nr:hypothetical protein [Candidatus Eremiobacteraeota bacterium]
MQHTTGVAVLATELPATDRRALSQAWYSALHLAERAPRARSASPRPAAQAKHGAAAFARDALDARGTTSAGDANTRGATRRDASTPRDASVPLAERRLPKSELARRIERALAQRPRGAPASFAVSAAGGRVRLLVRSDGARTRVVAVCAPPLRERVERALAQARFALAARGASGVRAEVA